MAHTPDSIKKRRDVVTVVFAVLVSLLLAAGMGSVALVWQRLEQAERNQAALADQVKSLGGTPVVEPKPGARGDQGPIGPQGPRGPQGIQGPPGIQGKQGPIGVTGQSPQCLLEPSRCVGPQGVAGGRGETGPQGSQGEPGATGAQGDQGEVGPQGPAGPQGDAGTDGADAPMIIDIDCEGVPGLKFTFSFDRNHPPITVECTP